MAFGVGIHVSATSGNSPASTLTTAARTLTAGSDVLIWTHAYVNTGANDEDISVTDSLGNTYAQVSGSHTGFASSSHRHGRWWLAKNVTGGSATFTYSPGGGGTNYPRLHVAEILLASTTANADQATALNVGGSWNTVLTTSPFTTTQASEIILGGVYDGFDPVGSAARAIETFSDGGATNNTGTWTQLEAISDDTTQEGAIGYAIVSSTGTYAVTVTESPQPPVDMGMAAISIKAAASTVSDPYLARAGARGQATATRKASPAHSARSGARAQDTATKAVSAAPAARAGARAQCTGIKTVTSPPVDRAGTRAQATAVAARTSTYAARAGAEAQATDTTTRTSTYATRTGLQAQTTETRTTSGAAQTSTGTRAQTVDTKAVSAAPTARSGAEAQSIAAKAVSGAAVGSLGARAQSGSALAPSAMFVARIGARAQCVGLRAASADPIGRVGANAQDITVKGGVSAPVARAGLDATSTGVAARVATFAATIGARGTLSATGGTSISDPAVTSVGTRAQCVGVKAIAATHATRTGTRALGSATKAAVAPTATRAGCRAVVVGSGTRSGAAIGTIGARGVNAVSGGVAPVAPSANYEECETDATLPDRVIWPDGVMRIYSNTEGGVDAPLASCPAPANSLKPWEI